MIVRNPNARCGNCPFWDRENQISSTGKEKGTNGKEEVVEYHHAACHVDLPHPILVPTAVRPPAIATAKNNAIGPQMTMKIQWNVFQPPSTHWCGRHPYILQDDEAAA